MLLRGSVLLSGEEEGRVDDPTSDPGSGPDGPSVRFASFSSRSGVISLLFLLNFHWEFPPYRIVD